MIDLEEVWLLEWSKKQGCVHIQPLLHAVNRAAKRFMADEHMKSDYEAIFAGTREQCDALSRKVHEIMDRRAKEGDRQ